ncbi:MAG: hypothetical protein Q8R98_03720, partial [Rubrivivax sp.]|nr:hypothetical protein [Rubrivivax sp.]
GALGLPGELVCELHGLPVATGDDEAELASSPAVALILSRARAAGARTADAPLSTLATLCRRLDGLPLALELAAARLPLLGLDGLMSSLDERLHAWVDTRSGRPAHHHSLNDLLNWSWQLLDPGEQQLLRRLGALHGSFTLELAQAAADASDRAQERGTFLDRFEHLRRLSLVAPEAEAQPQPPSAPTPPRWRLLDTTRQFAQQQLAQAGETESTALRVASAVARAFERLHREWWQGQRPEADIDREASPWVPELCAALDTACAHIGQHGALAAALWADGARTLALHGLRPRARVWADAAWSQRHRLPALQPLRMLAATTSVAPTGLLDSSARARALDEAARAAQTADNRPLWLELLLAAAQAARRASQLEAAGHGCSTLQQALRATDAPRWHARALELQATLHTYHGIGTPVSLQQLQEMLDDLRSAGDGDARVAFLLRIEVGERLLLQGQAAQARDSLQATCDAVARAGRWHERVLLAPFDTLAAAALACGDLQTAASALGLALDAARRTQQWPEATSVLAAYLAAQGRLRAAAELLGATQACLAQRGLGTDTMLAHSLAAAERVLQADSLPSERRRWLAQGWAAGEEGLRLWVGQAHRRFMP